MPIIDQSLHLMSKTIIFILKALKYILENFWHFVYAANIGIYLKILSFYENQKIKNDECKNICGGDSLVNIIPQESSPVDESKSKILLLNLHNNISNNTSSSIFKFGEIFTLLVCLLILDASIH